MISGEDVQINTKHATARAVTWRTPGLLAGNDTPRLMARLLTHLPPASLAHAC